MVDVAKRTFNESMNSDELKKIGAAELKCKTDMTHTFFHRPLALEQHLVNLWSSICCYRQLTFLPSAVFNIKNIRYAAV